jgi:hypothetical protein
MIRCAVGIELTLEEAKQIAVDIRTGEVLPTPIGCEVVGVGIVMDEGVYLEEDLPDSIPAVDVDRPSARVAGAGVASPSTMVIDPVAGVYLMNSRVTAEVAGVITVPGGFLPGYVGYDVRLAPLGEGEPAIEATAFALAERCDALRAAGVPVRRFVAIGPARLDPRVMQTFADVLAEKIAVAASDQPVLLGAAIHGCLAADPAVTGHAAMSLAVQAMARQREDLVYRPDIDARRAYAKRRVGP